MYFFVIIIWTFLSNYYTIVYLEFYYSIASLKYCLQDIYFIIVLCLQCFKLTLIIFLSFFLICGPLRWMLYVDVQVKRLLCTILYQLTYNFKDINHNHKVTLLFK